MCLKRKFLFRFFRWFVVCFLVFSLGVDADERKRTHLSFWVFMHEMLLVGVKKRGRWLFAFSE